MVNEIIVYKIKSYYKKYYSKVTPDWEPLVYDVLNEGKNEERLSLLSESLNIELKGKTMLELGSGFGLFVAIAQKKGIKCYGLEAEDMAYKTSLELLSEYGVKKSIKLGKGEKIPYQDEMFDIVVSFQVLEHTNKPKIVIQESLRVLKRGGYLYFVIPNYGSFWESHYAFFSLPYLPKSVLKLHAKFRKRDPDFLNEIHLITPKYLKKILKRENVEILDWGIGVWKRRMDAVGYTAWGQTQKLMKLIKAVRRLGFISLVKYLGERLNFYYPIILTVKKN